jgi:hypothetical protein
MTICKIVIIIRTILTLDSLFFLSFDQTKDTSGPTYPSDIDFLFNLPKIFGIVLCKPIVK